MKEIDKVESDLMSLGDSNYIKSQVSYFAAFSGGYGEGDLFYGVKVPVLRKYLKDKEYNQQQLDDLFASKFHETRFLGLLALLRSFSKASVDEKERLFRYYLQMVKKGFINNWDMIDLSAPLMGSIFIQSPEDFKRYSYLSQSKNVWERRLHIMLAFAFKSNNVELALYACRLAINDSDKLVTKPAGWLIREVGKYNKEAFYSFLNSHYSDMPRESLRYAIERLDSSERNSWLRKSPT
jgi:3-methyladenine DNA glycosylase AlkD